MSSSRVALTVANIAMMVFIFCALPGTAKSSSRFGESIRLSSYLANLLSRSQN